MKIAIKIFLLMTCLLWAVDSQGSGLADIEILANDWLKCTDPEIMDCGPYWWPDPDLGLRRIPHGTVTVDGDLSEWADAKWFDLDMVYYPDPYAMESARCALQWNSATGKIYVAAEVTDTIHIFSEPNEVGAGRTDGIDLYCKGIDSGDAVYDPNFPLMQYYLLRVQGDSSGTWANDSWWVWGSGISSTESGTDDVLEHAVNVVGDQLIYEAAVTPFDYFAGIVDPNGTSDITSLYPGKVVRFDVIAVDRWDTLTDFWGMKALDGRIWKQQDPNTLNRWQIVN
jgi:hypothetical protein